MLRYRRAASRAADVVHFEWLTVPRLDLRLLPARPTVLTIHDPLERGREPLPASALRIGGRDRRPLRVREAGCRGAHGLDPSGSTSSATGPDTGWGTFCFQSRNSPSIPSELRDTGEPVVLSYGLIRPYKGIETLLEAWRGIDSAQLWIVGRPMMDISDLLAAAPAGARLVPRFVTPAEEAALFARADLVVLPYERSERFGFSGVLATALGHGKAIVLSDVGGFAEVADLRAAYLVPPADPQALRAALERLIADEEGRARLAAAAAEAAAEEYSWDAAARATLALYETIAAA